jgi:hypothetical protein
VKLQPDLFRAILLWAEENLPSENSSLEFPLVEGFDEKIVAYHCLMLDDAGYVVAIDATDMSSPFPQRYPIRLTYIGHQHLENVRDPEIWNKTKAGAKSVGSFGIETLGLIARGLINTQVEKLTGLELDL